MNVILKDNIESLGKAGDRVKVSDGYARNFLIPKGLAIEATSRNLKLLEHEKSFIIQKIRKEKNESETLLEKLNGVTCTIARRVGEQGKLFGSVTTKDIGIALQKQGIEIDRKNIVLEETLKSLGEFPVKIKLNTGITANIKIIIIDEA